MQFLTSDLKFMSYAINLAKTNLGATSPNPVVACVITCNNQIIATGITAKNGRPHAEKIAIEKVVNKKILKDATIYVTLEPCSHFGQTPPCVDEIIKYQFKKVVIATTDKDSRVNGSGIKKLKEAGIEVVLGVLENEAQEINRGFFKAKTTGTPFVSLKIASSLDGKIATKNFDSKWITNEKARLFSHQLRANHDAILIGANTVKYDDPSLDCRISGLEEFSPKKIIISKNSDFSFAEKIFSNQEVFILRDETQRKSEILPPNVKVIYCAEKNAKIDLKDALKKLAENGINSLLVEGGGATASEFLQQNLVDELIWIRGSKIIGNDAIPAISELNHSKISDCLQNFQLREIKELDGDVAEIFTLKKGPGYF